MLKVVDCFRPTRTQLSARDLSAAVKTKFGCLKVVLKAVKQGFCAAKPNRTVDYKPLSDVGIILLTEVVIDWQRGKIINVLML